MARKSNAPARKGEGAACQIGVDTSAHSMIEAARHLYLERFGLPAHRAALIAPFAFGEAGHA